MSTNNGGAAFPMFGRDAPINDGMTLRDWFAGQALSSIPLRSWDDLPSSQHKIEAWAQTAYAVADAMLALRSPQGSGRP